jgi:hypothetical protein
MSGWSKKDLGIAAVTLAVANPVIAVIGLVIVGVLFAVVYATLVIFGLVSALIYGAFGLILVWLIGSASKTALENHWWIVLIIPVFFVFGWFSDRMGSLGLNWLPSHISQNVVFTQNTWANGSQVTVYGPWLIALIAFVVAALAFVVSINTHKKFWWVGHKRRCHR